jgi:oligopeptide/dipeptide ABC transporter ATP-binding protein
VMYLGNIVEIAETDELIFRPAHPYTRALLSAVAVPDPDYKHEEVPIMGDIPSPINLPKGCRFKMRCPFAQKECGNPDLKLAEVSKGHFVLCAFADKFYGDIKGTALPDIDPGIALERQNP